MALAVTQKDEVAEGGFVAGGCPALDELRVLGNLGNAGEGAEMEVSVVAGSR